MAPVRPLSPKAQIDGASLYRRIQLMSETGPTRLAYSEEDVRGRAVVMEMMREVAPDDPAFQPGFDRVDTSVSAAVCLYGYYGNRDPGSRSPSSPHAYIRKDAPPFFVAHGANDTFVPVASKAARARTRCAASR